MKAKKHNLDVLAEGLQAGLRSGSVNVPHLFLTSYVRLGLSETEAMLLIQLMTFIQRENKDFPTLVELRARLAASEDVVIKSWQRLLTEGYLSIEEGQDALSGVRYERYNLDALYAKLAAVWVEDNGEPYKEKPRKPEQEKNLFSVFEKEFGRPITPMELETISGWLDQDGYREELILAALKEAVFAGKVHFRYIDRILLDWQRNRIQTVEQAKEHGQRFRGRQ